MSEVELSQQAALRAPSVRRGPAPAGSAPAEPPAPPAAALLPEAWPSPGRARRSVVVISRCASVAVRRLEIRPGEPQVVAVVAVPARQKWPAGQGCSARSRPVTSQTKPAGQSRGTCMPCSGHR